ncbi:hypothetical protein O3M35_009116 [Rhynocoris fuscipes]|uniref:Transmembrane protein n=1 Tax=Rhynocoris fuscipes TaxID=488301 RepID=A0AAW1D406_9HEMI
MKNPCKKITINLAVESINSLKEKSSRIRDVDCPPIHSDVCHKRLQLIPLPIRKIKKKQIQICKCPTVDFICPPVPCICPPCPICPTTGERIRHLLKTGLKLAALLMLFKWTWDQNIWSSSDYTAQLTTYYKSCYYSLYYGEEQQGIQMAENELPGFVDARITKFKLQSAWNKAVTTFFYCTVGLPLLCINKVKNAIKTPPDYDDDDY